MVLNVSESFCIVFHLLWIWYSFWAPHTVLLSLLGTISWLLHLGTWWLGLCMGHVLEDVDSSDSLWDVCCVGPSVALLHLIMVMQIWWLCWKEFALVTVMYLTRGCFCMSSDICIDLVPLLWLYGISSWLSGHIFWLSHLIEGSEVSSWYD